jgi:hypothetical protein
MTARIMREFRQRGRTRGSGRGSRRRLRKIRLRDNWSPGAIVFLIMLLLIFTVLIPWLIRHPPDDPDQPVRPGFHAAQ